MICPRCMGIVMIWISYLVKYLSEYYKFGIIRNVRLHYYYACIKINLKIYILCLFLVFEISGMIRDNQWVNEGSDDLGFISHLILIRIL